MRHILPGVGDTSGGGGDEAERAAREHSTERYFSVRWMLERERAREESDDCSSAFAIIPVGEKSVRRTLPALPHPWLARILSAGWIKKGRPGGSARLDQRVANHVQVCVSFRYLWQHLKNTSLYERKPQPCLPCTLHTTDGLPKKGFEAPPAPRVSSCESFEKRGSTTA